MSTNLKQNLSLIPVTVPIGFIYWLQEDTNMRGLKSLNILDFPSKLNELLEEYNSKYPKGLTGWS